MENEIKIQNGLKELSADRRDLSLGAVFNLGDISDIPKVDFDVSRESPLKDQKETDFCTGYAVSDASEDQEEIDLSPEFQFGITKEMSGDPEEWGADLRTACKSAVDVGSIPQKLWDDEYGIERRYDRSIVAHADLWPKWWRNVAKDYKKSSFFAAKGEHDAFDNIRLALWSFREEKRSIVCGILWRDAWTKSKDGIIDKVLSSEGSGHAFHFVGQKIINDKIYLKARLSNGVKIGDKGFYYFSREVVNKEVPRFGMFMFVDMPKEQAKVLQEYGWKLNFVTSLLSRLVVMLNNLIK